MDRCCQKHRVKQKKLFSRFESDMAHVKNKTKIITEALGQTENKVEQRLETCPSGHQKIKWREGGGPPDPIRVIIIYKGV